VLTSARAGAKVQPRLAVFRFPVEEQLGARAAARKTRQAQYVRDGFHPLKNIRIVHKG
jgi:hypothetical protein